MPRADAPRSALDVGHEQRAEPLTAPIVGDRKCELALEPIGRKHITRFADHHRRATDARLRVAQVRIFGRGG